jgi:hypothetical protein
MSVRYAIVCNWCDTVFADNYDTLKEARQAAKEAGWVVSISQRAAGPFPVPTPEGQRVDSCRECMDRAKRKAVESLGRPKPRPIVH